MKINIFSIFNNKTKSEKEDIFKLKLDGSMGMIASDRKRYLDEYSTEEARKYINNHFDKLQEELAVIDYKQDFKKIEFFGRKIIEKDEELFTYLNNSKV